MKEGEIADIRSFGQVASLAVPVQKAMLYQVCEVVLQFPVYFQAAGGALPVLLKTTSCVPF